MPRKTLLKHGSGKASIFFFVVDMLSANGGGVGGDS